MSSLLQVKNLSVDVQDENKSLNLVDQVNFEITAKQIYALVGESGSGKSVTALSLLGVPPQPNGNLEGSIKFKGQPLLELSEVDWRKYRGSEIAYIPQDSKSALNPLVRIEKQMLECFKYHSTRISKHQRILEVLIDVGFGDNSKQVLHSFPHQLSGGMLQRITIAMGLLFEPQLLVADEPTAALDVTIQSQIMDLFLMLKQEKDLSILLITHNMHLVYRYADFMSVMYAGRILERGNVEEIFKNPLHPYTQGLLKSLPYFSKEIKIPKTLRGIVPHPYDYQSGCRFINRCDQKRDGCKEFCADLNYNNRWVNCLCYLGTKKPN